jgi:hypothetical protein
MDTEQLLDIIELELTQHRAFGDSEYIRGQVVSCLERRLNTISSRLPVAGHLLDALGQADCYTRYRVLGDSVVRCVIEYALTQLETGSAYGLPLNECEEVLREAFRLLADGKCGAPLESRVTAISRLGAESYHGWVWGAEQPDDIFGRSLRNIVQSNYGESLHTPDANEIAMLRRATCLLEELLPSLSRSALSHAQVIAVFPAVGKWKGRSSASQIRITGIFFLSRAGLDEPWYLAEHIFHEALHQKLYDFRLGHSLLEPDYWKDDAPRICSLWNEPSKSHNWDTHRAVAAFHVYVHLGLLCTIAERRATELEAVYGPLRGMSGSRKSLERARYLGEQIKTTCWDELGLAGKYLVEWLMSVLDALDASPPPEGSSIHLLLDRYEREAARVAAVLGRLGPQGFDGGAKADIPGQLTTLVKEEANNVCSALSAVHAGENLNRFSNAIAQFSDAELGVRFGEVRRLISRTLLDLSPDGRGYRLDGSPLESKRAEEIVRQMVESSSHRLDNILAL